MKQKSITVRFVGQDGEVETVSFTGDDIGYKPEGFIIRIWKGDKTKVISVFALVDMDLDL